MFVSGIEIRNSKLKSLLNQETRNLVGRLLNKVVLMSTTH